MTLRNVRSTMSTVNIGSMPMNLKHRSVPVRKQAQVALVVLVAVRVQAMVRMVTDLIGIRPMDRNFPGMVVASPISLNLCSETGDVVVLMQVSVVRITMQI